MWPRMDRAKEALHFALSQRTRRGTNQDQTSRESLASLTPSELLAVFLSRYQGKTQENYRIFLRAWERHCLSGGRTLLTVDAPFIDQYIAGRRRQGLKPSTASSQVSYLRTFYHWCYQHEVIPRDVSSLIKPQPRPTSSTQRPLSIREIQAFLEATATQPPPWPGLILLFAMSLRRSEALQAPIGDLETYDGHMTLVLRDRKMGDDHRVLIPSLVAAHIRAAIGDRKTGPIFQINGRPVTEQRLYKTMDTISEAAKLDHNVRPHQLRAAFITHLRNQGATDRDIAASAGLSSTKMVDYYDREFRSLARSLTREYLRIFD